MMRGPIIAVAMAGCMAQAVLAQGVARARYEQQNLDQRYGDGAPRYHRDPHFRPAANTAAAQHRARREGAPQAPKKSNPGGSFAARLGITNLLPKSFRGGGDNTEQEAQPPMPYDSAELGPPQRPTRNGQPRTNPSRQMPSRSPMARQQMPARATQQARAPQPKATAPTSRIERSSPVVSPRRNELAEALSGLAGAENVAEESAEATESFATADAGDEAPPEVEDTEELPSYLREARSAPRIETTKARPAPAQSMDLRDALVGEVDSGQAPSPQTAKASVAREVAVRAAAVAADSDFSEPPMPEPSTPRPSTMRSAAKPKAAMSKPTRPAPKVEDETDDSMGAIAAEEPNAAFVDAAVESTSKPQEKAPAARAVKSGLLFTSSQPVITSNIEGPQRIVVGREATYRVTVQNTGDVAARELTATIAAPAGAEVVDAVASNGTVDRGSADQTAPATEIKWSLYELPPRASQTLTLQLIPRSGREMQLGVQLTHAPVISQATVEIQEPKLQMEINGPSDVLFGKSQRYALTLSNPGNGAAEDVSIELTPPGGGPDSKVRHKVGTLAAGESKKIELELTAREAGELKIHALAVASGDLRTESIKTVMCRKPALQVDWRGPDKKYAGAVATYYFRVRNPGTAPAEQVAVQVNLPAGAELVEASEGHAWDADRRAIMWKGAGLNAGEERFMQVQCRMSQPGVNKMELSAQTASGDLSDAKSVPVTVEALADLKLEVSDPKGVVPVGDMTVYEVRIKNRGQSSARGVNVVAMFSDGIDPSHVEGGQHTIRDGRVSFRTIDSLAAGSETVFKIHAKASKPGTHVFRTEVACDELGAKLAAEETTLFFDGEERWADASTAYADEADTTTR